ncbi:MAG: alpha-galactosidase, partial [Lewinella sp.]|nr:alpha-galactosidase [Lewinella sp.]
MPYWKLLPILLILHISQAYSQVRYADQIFYLENDVFQKQILIPNKGSGSLRVQAILDSDGKNVLSQNTESPLFEFLLDKVLVTALQPLWRYEGYTTRNMGNGGTEVIISISGNRNPVKGLQLKLYQQIFPGTTLMRERLEIQAEAGRSFPLSKWAKQIHFIFPQYDIATTSAPVATEIRIASWASELIDMDAGSTYDDRFPGGQFNDHNLAMNHMYHPRVTEQPLPADSMLLSKGPINVLRSGELQWVSTYEHASQDDLRGLFKQEGIVEGGIIRDAAQGTKGVFNFPIAPGDFHFLGIAQEAQRQGVRVGIRALRGAYLEGELIDDAHPYSSVWTATAFSRDTSTVSTQRMLHDYLWKWICEKPASRRPEFYYNTWGMQRRLNGQGHDLRGVLTEQKIIEEIQRAAELNVDIFVLDDGWEQAQGDWTPHKERLPNGLEPIKKELDKHGIKMGLWFSPMGIDKTTDRYQAHPEWVIRDSEGNPIGAQWDHPAFDFVSGFYDLFIQDCKKLIDAGARFFKWDAINTFYSVLPNLEHGSGAYSQQELRARYEYLLPIYVTRAMQELTDYEPELVIEIDLTEARRVMNGLAPLSQGKVFWMNNGASGYNDYSVYRAKSMRSIPNQYAGILPLELFTYANYPHDYRYSQRYNVNTSLITGHGFWGALEELKEEERKAIGETVAKSKRVLPYTTEVLPEVIGRVGSSPEIYTLVNQEAGAGQIIAFSGQAMEYLHRVKINTAAVLGVLNHAYLYA